VKPLGHSKILQNCGEGFKNEPVAQLKEDPTAGQKKTRGSPAYKYFMRDVIQDEVSNGNT